MNNGREVGPKLLLRIIKNSNGWARSWINVRVSVHWSKMYSNPHEGATAPSFLP